MTTGTRTVGRESVKENQVLERLRQQILTGELQPGSRLLTRRELEQRMEVSRVTLQRVLDRLSEDGFVYAKGPQGTYVAENPPHLCRYELVFPGRDQPEKPWPRFWQALQRQAAQIDQDQNHQRRISLAYHGEGHADSEDYQELIRTVRSHRAAGLIFATPATPVLHTPVTEDPQMPCVEIRVASPSDSRDPAVAAVVLDRVSFIDKAIADLNQRGRRRIAVISTAHWYTRNESEMAVRLGDTPSFWRQAVDLTAAEFANNCVQLMMRGPSEQRPDGLIIADDNLVEHATAGLVSAGIRVPHDLDVVAHCNFPWPTPSVVPVRRLGYDAHRVLQASIEAIDRQRTGRRKSAITRIEAVFEEELKPH